MLLVLMKIFYTHKKRWKCAVVTLGKHFNLTWPLKMTSVCVTYCSLVDLVILKKLTWIKLVYLGISKRRGHSKYLNLSYSSPESDVRIILICIQKNTRNKKRYLQFWWAKPTGEKKKNQILLITFFLFWEMLFHI